MNRGRARAVLLSGLILAVLLALTMVGTAIADPDKDESGKGKQSQEQESGESKDRDDGGGGESNEDDRDDANDDRDDDRNESTSSEGSGSGGGGSSGSGGGGSTGSGGDGDGDGDRERQRSTASSSQPTDGGEQGNIPCSSLGSGYVELKLQNPGTGTYSDGTLTVNFTRTGEGTFSWTSNIDVDAVIAKGGSGSNVYSYPGTADGFSGSATTPTNPSNGTPYGLSHVSFCYDTAAPPTTPPPTTPPGPPTTPPGPPPPPPTTPDDEVLGDLITDGDVDGDSIEGDSVEGGSTSGSEAESRGGILPFTGAGIVTYGLLGLLMTGAGVLLARRRRRS